MSKKKVFVIGIDGATFDLLRPWMEDGILPNLYAIARNGASGELQSTFPPNSAPAWTSFMTGMNPGKHGIYGFTRLEPKNGYGIKINSGAQRRVQTIWQYLSEQDKRSIVINVPMTYPPNPINGLVVTGIDTPGLESQFTYPSEFRQEIFHLAPDYILDIQSWGVTATGERRAHILDDILRMVDSRRRLALHLMKTQPWDHFTLVFTATDRAQHFFWRFLDPDHPLHDPSEASKYKDSILRVYRHVDQIIGELMACCGEDTTIIIMSDHGFGPQHKLFRINQWLIEKGFLQLSYADSNGKMSHLSGLAQKWSYHWLGSLNRLVRVALSDTAKYRLKRLFPKVHEQVTSQLRFSGVDWSKSQAFHTAEFPGSIRINLKGREVNGAVEPGAEYEAVCKTIKSQLENYRDPDTGKRVVQRVFRREEIYWGTCLVNAPDLIVHLADYSYTFEWHMPQNGNGNRKSLPIVDALTGKYATSCGYHRLNGILMLYGANIRKGVQLDPAQIYDVAPTILYLLGLPVPSDMDGRVVKEAIQADLLNRRFVKHRAVTAKASQGASSEEPYSEMEAEKVANRLRDIGYM